MKGTSTAISLLFLLMTFGLAFAANDMHARDTELSDYYSANIDRKIDVAKRVAGDRFLNDTREFCLSDVAREKIEFYTSNKDDLVREMLSREEIGRLQHKVDYFLITTFNKNNSEVVNTCRFKRDKTGERAESG